MKPALTVFAILCLATPISAQETPRLGNSLCEIVPEISTGIMRMRQAGYSTAEISVTRQTVASILKAEGLDPKLVRLVYEWFTDMMLEASGIPIRATDAWKEDAVAEFDARWLDKCLEAEAETRDEAGAE